jgi:hypothetical protein
MLRGRTNSPVKAVCFVAGAGGEEQNVGRLLLLAVAEL